MIGANRVYLLGMEVRVSEGEFRQAVQDSRWDRAEGNGSVGTVFSDVIQLLLFHPEYPKLQVPQGGPAHVHVQEGESVVCAGFEFFSFLS